MDLIVRTVIHGGLLALIWFLLEEVKHLNNRIEKLEKKEEIKMNERIVERALSRCCVLFGRTQYRGEVEKIEEVQEPLFGDVITFQNKVMFFNNKHKWTEFNI